MTEAWPSRRRRWCLRSSRWTHMGAGERTGTGRKKLSRYPPRRWHTPRLPPRAFFGFSIFDRQKTIFDKPMVPTGRRIDLRSTKVPWRFIVRRTTNMGPGGLSIKDRSNSRLFSSFGRYTVLWTAKKNADKVSVDAPILSTTWTQYLATLCSHVSPTFRLRRQTRQLTWQVSVAGCEGRLVQAGFRP